MRKDTYIIMAIKSLTIFCSSSNSLSEDYYIMAENLGKFLTEIEQSPRLIAVNKFSVKNGLERIKRRYNEEDLLYQVIDIDISTLTLIKSKTSHI